MCGRLFIKPVTELNQLMDMLSLLKVTLPILNNVAPTENIPLIIHTENGFDITPVRWWLHPHWSKEEPNQKFAMFNARIETILTAPSFRGPVQYRRGIVPAAGFIEWKREGKNKQPYYIDAGDQPLLLAAVWDVWQDQLISCAVITQPANAAFETVHNRMPLSLTLEQAKRWLDPQQNPKQLIADFSGTSLLLHMRPVSSKVNNARNKDDVEFLDEIVNE